MLGGKLVHQTSDEYGTIEVVDYMDQLRAMHFGNSTQQSTSLLCNPFFLIHKYAQAMLLPLCWLQAKRVLVLGLGAGSIVKYLYQYHPELKIDAIELRSSVTEVAHDFFMLPNPDERLTIYNSSAEDWLKSEINHKYDLIIVDLFLTANDNKDITVDIATSLQSIPERLTQKGVATFNHLAKNIQSYPGFNEISKCFDYPLHSINIESTNSILLASLSPIPEIITDSELSKMSAISTLPYEQYFNDMILINS